MVINILSGPPEEPVVTFPTQQTTYSSGFVVMIDMQIRIFFGGLTADEARARLRLQHTQIDSLRYPVCPAQVGVAHCHA